MAAIGAEGPVWALGLMSGTSMDGVDAALLLTDGEEIAGFGPSLFRPAAPGGALAEVAADWRRFRPPAGEAERRRLAEAEAEVDGAHAAAAAELMARAEEPAALIGYHGQTVAHAPEEGWTWQLGDGAALARALGRPVAWDFRSADMAAGGEGAPLAPFHHFALARRIGAEAPLAFLNVGGVANVTWVDPAAPAPEAPGALVAFDTGPGNALVNDLVQARLGLAMDEGGGIAARGRARRLGSNAAAAYLARRPPKSLDRNAFASALAEVEGLGVEDAAASLTAFTAEAVAAGARHLPAPPSRWLVCGGGRRNATLMAMLAERLDAPVAAVEEAGLDGDMLEAQAFAHLAVRVARKLPLSAPGTTGCRAPAPGGRIARPG